MRLALLGESRRLFPVLWGLWFVNNQRGEYQRARELAEHLLAVAEQNRDPAL